MGRFPLWEVSAAVDRMVLVFVFVPRARKDRRCKYLTLLCNRTTGGTVFHEERKRMGFRISTRDAYSVDNVHSSMCPPVAHGGGGGNLRKG